ncbi:MAG: hypothetical protein KatS3mg082_2550 [Nitrospiraceae bacterium]|nr:MAG: hypothetical protein KatS3mg082_2550 [Nitrospiraceae bacterium]
MEFIRRHQCPVRSLAAFEKSQYADDWRELMRLYLVRRTRTFIQGQLRGDGPRRQAEGSSTFEDGTKAYFPDRVPKTLKFKIGKADDDQYARLYSDEVVDIINHLNLPRYALGNYLAPSPHEPPKQAEAKVIQDLSRAGRRLMGFCRTNLFKRLESSGHAFLQSVERHILRNYIYLHAIDNNLALPIGTQDAELLDPAIADRQDAAMFADDGRRQRERRSTGKQNALRTEARLQKAGQEIYDNYAGPCRNGRFKWLRPGLFVKQLADDLRDDIKALLKVLKLCGDMGPQQGCQAGSALEPLCRRSTQPTRC